MKSRALIAAVITAGLGALALHTYLARYEAEVAGGAPRPIVVVTRDLALGEVLTQSALSVRDLPDAYVEERHIAADDLERVIGTRLTSAVPTGSALLWTDLDVMQEGRTLSGLVRHGMRAYALAAGDVSFDGLLRPGDRVDVLVRAQERAGAPRIVLENVLVLTVGSDLGGDEQRTGNERSGPVTLSVTTAQAETLAVSEAEGELKLLLRNPQDLVLRESTGAHAQASEASVVGEADHGR